MQVSLQMVRIGPDRSDTMGSDGRVHHRPELGATVFGPWRCLGENVGRTGYAPGESIGDAVVRLHRAFMDSPGHRDNGVSYFNHVGVVVDEDGNLWATFNFLKGPGGRFPLLEDIGDNAHERSTEQVWV